VDKSILSGELAQENEGICMECTWTLGEGNNKGE
jgi:hypothetical protein